MIKPLTSLRFFFALMVFTSHLDFVKGAPSWYNWLSRNIFFEGYLGVSFFFILSGFVLSYSYKEKIIYDSISLKDFYIARFARVYPLHLLTLFLILPFTFHNHIFDGFKFILNLFLLQSFIPKQEYFFCFNSPSWSISNEMFFYLIFPFIIVLFNRFVNLKNIIFIIVPLLLIFSIAFTSSNVHKSFFYINPVLRSLDFIIGILLCDLFRNKTFSKLFNTYNKSTIVEITSALIFLIFFAFHNYFERGYRYSIYYWFPMCFVIFAFAHQKGYISKLLSNKWLVLLGEISFAFYMIHYLIIKYGLWLKYLYLKNLNDLVFSLILLFITLLLSYVTFKFYEKPMNSFTKKKLIKNDS